MMIDLSKIVLIISRDVTISIPEHLLLTGTAIDRYWYWYWYWISYSNRVNDNSPSTIEQHHPSMIIYHITEVPITYEFSRYIVDDNLWASTLARL